MLARLAIRALRDDIAFTPGNNIGYHGPYTELLSRAGASRAIGEGCLAGVTVLGIEADGTVKGCPSLPAERYAGGNIRTQRLSEMLAQFEELAINLRARAAPPSDALGILSTCEFADRCRGGCTWTAHCVLWRAREQPVCHHRALVQRSQGYRERVVQVAAAPGVPFDNGIFEIVRESVDQPWPADDQLRFIACRSCRRPAGGGVVGSFRLACRRWYSSCSPRLPSLKARDRGRRLARHLRSSSSA